MTTIFNSLRLQYSVTWSLASGKLSFFSLWHCYHGFSQCLMSCSSASIFWSSKYFSSLGKACLLLWFQQFSKLIARGLCFSVGGTIAQVTDFFYLDCLWLYLRIIPDPRRPASPRPGRAPGALPYHMVNKKKNEIRNISLIFITPGFHYSY